MVVLEVKSPFGRSKRKWENNIKADLKEIEMGGRGQICLPEDRNNWRTLVDTALNVWAL